MEAWIPITIVAAFMQNARSSLQKHLKGRLSTSGATFSRFVFATPFAILALVVLVFGLGYPLPGFTLAFALNAMAGGLCQIIATALLVSIFSSRNFAVGTTFSKTETVQTALFGLVILGDRLSLGAMIGIAVSLVGVMIISLSRAGNAIAGGVASWFDRSALIGIASGSFFGLSAVTYRAAALSLEEGDFIIRAITTLALATLFQTIVMGLYIRLREPGQITEVMRSWRVSGLVGLTGMLASACWFMAMTLQNAAYVRALGQVELIFTFVSSYFFFGERSTRGEIGGIILVTLGVLILLLGR